MILLKNGTYIDWETLEFRQTDILVHPGPGTPLDFLPPSPGGRACLPDRQEAGREATQVLDCTGRYITKSFANSHHHVYSALATGMPAPPKQPGNFREILEYVWWRLDKALDPASIRASALVTAIACAKNGVTFVIDHHASPHSVEGSLEIIAEAFESVGIGHLLCYEISDRDGAPIAREGLDETARYLQKRQGLVGLHASFTVSDETLGYAVKIASRTGSGIHIHVAEDRYDQEQCMAKYHKRVVVRLHDAGALQFPKTILGHCLHLDDHERTLVASSPAWVVQNMESNLNNSVGFFNSKGLGDRIMLGTDGMHSDMLQSARSAFFAGHNYDTIDYPGAYHRFRNVHHYLGSNAIAGDGENNLVVLDYRPHTPFTRDNFFGHFLFGLGSQHVSHVISQGRLIVNDRKVVTVDEEKILHDANVQSRRLWERMGGQ